jgi:hypothetical protein
MCVPCEQNTLQNHKVKISYISFENVVKFRYLGTTLADQNCVFEEIKSR